MGWAQVRQAASEIVHATFALSARYYANGNVSGVGLPVSVRVHSKIVAIGDLHNEGYSKSYDDNETVVFSLADVLTLGVKVGGVLKVEDGRIFRLRVKTAVLDGYRVEFMVTRV
jgi:hypothetical protein